MTRPKRRDPTRQKECTMKFWRPGITGFCGDFRHLYRPADYYALGGAGQL